MEEPIKVAKLGSDVKEIYTLDDGATILDALGAAGVNAAGMEVRRGR